MYNIAARPMISGLILKYLKEAHWVVSNGCQTTVSAWSQFFVTTPVASLNQKAGKTNDAIGI